MPIMALIGQGGTGKTHLGQAWAQRSGAVILNGYEVLEVKPAWRNRAVFLDVADKSPEPVLFTIMNLALNGDIPTLLMASRHIPKLWEFDLPDLTSRLQNVSLLHLGDHEDILLEPIIRKLFEDRGRQITHDCVSYIIKTCDRSVDGLRRVVTQLDLAAQAQKADITKAFIVRTLKTARQTSL